MWVQTVDAKSPKHGLFEGTDVRTLNNNKDTEEVYTVLYTFPGIQ